MPNLEPEQESSDPEQPSPAAPEAAQESGPEPVKQPVADPLAPDQVLPSASAAPGRHFLPVDLELLIEDLTEHYADDRAGREQVQVFTRFAGNYRHLLQLSLFERARLFKRLYQPFNPDEENQTQSVETEERARRHKHLLGALPALLVRANFIEVPREKLDAALQKTSPVGLQVSVDLEQFDDFAFFIRGFGEERTTRRTWRNAFLRPIEEVAPTYRRVFLLLKEKGSEHIYLKLFKDVPFSDLEMLLPNTKVRMSSFDRAKIGVTGGGGTIGGLMAMLTKLGAAANPSTWAFALVGFAGVIWRQLSKVLNQRSKYMAALTKRLYYHSLDNNFGVLTRVLEMALEEECKEAILATHFLLLNGPQRPVELDRRVESYVKERYGVDVDYEVGDGLKKIERLNLVRAEEDGRRHLQPDGDWIRFPDLQPWLSRLS